MGSRVARFGGALVAVVLGYFLLGQAHEAWRNYWLRTDARWSTAVVIKEGEHGTVKYRYRVGKEQYTGWSFRNWRDPKYSNVQVGGESSVCYSESRPWLSCLYMPDTVVEGLPVLVIAFLFVLFGIATVIRPGSGWAFDFRNNRIPGSSRARPRL
jgi:hypothetical protein